MTPDTLVSLMAWLIWTQAAVSVVGLWVSLSNLREAVHEERLQSRGRLLIVARYVKRKNLAVVAAQVALVALALSGQRIASWGTEFLELFLLRQALILVVALALAWWARLDYLYRRTL